MTRLFRQIAMVSFSLLFVSFPFSKFLVTIGVLGLVVSAFGRILFENVRTKHLYDLRLLIPLVALYFLMVLSLFYTDDISMGLRELRIQNGLVLVPILLMVHWDIFKTNTNRLLFFLSLSTIGCSIITLTFYFLPDDLAKAIINQLPIFQDYPVLINKIQFGLYSPFIDRLHFAYILCFVFVVQLFEFHRNKLIFRGITILLCAPMILILGARGAQVALLFALIPYVFYLFLGDTKWSIKSFVKACVCSIILILLLPFGLYKTVPVVKARYDQMRWELDMIQSDEFIAYDYQHFTTLTRMTSIKATWEACKRHPFTGVGIGDVRKELSNEYEKLEYQVSLHNQNYFLYIWMACGLLAPIIFITFLLGWLKTIWGTSSRWKSMMALSYFTFLLVILSLDVVLKYHIGVFSIPFFLMMIYAFPLKNKT